MVLMLGSGLVLLTAKNWVQLMATQTETSLGCLSEERKAIQRVLVMEMCLGQPTELCLELLTETLKGKSLGCSSAGLMAMKMVLMMESDWVELTEMYSEQLTESQMETSLVCLSAVSMETQLGLSLVQQTDVGSEKLTEKPTGLRSE